jgi:hypothetical protein
MRSMWWKHDLRGRYEGHVQAATNFNTATLRPDELGISLNLANSLKPFIVDLFCRWRAVILILVFFRRPPGLHDMVDSSVSCIAVKLAK